MWCNSNIFCIFAHAFGKEVAQNDRTALIKATPTSAFPTANSPGLFTSGTPLKTKTLSYADIYREY